MAVASSSICHREASVLRAPARTDTPASPKVARLSPVAVSQALRTSNSTAFAELRFLVRSKLSN